MKHHRPKPQRKRRPHSDGAHAPAEAHEAAPAPSVALLRDAGAPEAQRAAAIAGMQRAAGNAAVERALVTASAPLLRRQSAGAAAAGGRTGRKRRGARKRWRANVADPKLIGALLKPESPLWRQLNPDKYAQINCPAAAASVDEYLSTGSISPAPAGNVFSNFEFRAEPWSSPTSRFNQVRAVVSQPNSFVVVEGKRSRSFAETHNITREHYFVIVNYGGSLKVLDAYGEGQVFSDVSAYIREQGFAQFRYYRGSFRVVHVSHDPDDLPF